LAAVELQGVVKSYDAKVTVVHGVDLQIRHGEFVVFVGPSGCGKSTLLRLVAGLEPITGGTVAIDGKVVNDLPPRHRDIAMVFQDYALYPHKTLYDNMAFGLRLRKTPEDDIQRRVMDAAKLLHIDHLLDRRPAALSGGQRQRVAIGRALVRQPKVFLFDEPLSNLDAQLRHEMRTEIKRLHQRLGATILYVTHDKVEAMTLADRIAVLSAGRLMQYDTPEAIYNRPAALFVAGFSRIATWCSRPTSPAWARRMGGAEVTAIADPHAGSREAAAAWHDRRAPFLHALRLAGGQARLHLRRQFGHRRRAGAGLRGAGRDGGLLRHPARRRPGLDRRGDCRRPSGALVRRLRRA
jgi:ABC-type Fe3+/spermidine/putrescine transport system ATPase subunit